MFCVNVFVLMCDFFKSGLYVIYEVIFKTLFFITGVDETVMMVFKFSYLTKLTIVIFFAFGVNIMDFGASITTLVNIVNTFFYRKLFFMMIVTLI